MAFENGYNVYDYFSGIFLRYCEDHLIFTKLLQQIDIYKNRPDFPYCFKELSDAIELLANQKASSLYRASYVAYDDKSEWNVDGAIVGKDILLNRIEELRLNKKNLETCFKKELLSFLKHIDNIYEIYYSYANNPNGIKEVSFIYEKTRDHAVVRIERNDSKCLDFCVNEKSIDKVINQFASLRERLGR